MKVANETIEELVQVINESHYRKGQELVDFFNQFGFDHTYINVQKAGSRGNYTRDVLNSINGTAKLDSIIKQAVHPRNYINAQVKVEEIVDHLNKFLVYDGYEIERKGSLYEIKYNNPQQGGTLKNLIFASNGYKPELVLKDTLTYEIKIVANQQSVLIYDQPIGSGGLSWHDLSSWWASNNNITHNIDHAFYTRLESSLGSPPEHLFFRTYYENYNPNNFKSFPILIPQVYLHYDPYTLKQLNGGARIPRQRMDFLMILPGNNKIVIEIDGIQHYADDNTLQGSPLKYASMVAEDRRLKLRNYQVYRFGGNELMANNPLQEAMAKTTVIEFFEELFNKHSINLEPKPPISNP